MSLSAIVSTIVSWLTSAGKTAPTPTDGADGGAEKPPWHTHTICVAGLSNVGKSAMLKAHIEYDRPLPGWNSSAKVPWLRGDGLYTILQVSDISIRGDPLPPTAAPYILQTVLLKPRSGQEIRLRVVDVAGEDFKALSAAQGPWQLDSTKKEPLLDTNGEKIPTTLSLLLDAQVLLLMIAPEDVADGDRKGKIVTSLGQLQGARQERNLTHLPSIHVIFTKADEYGLPWSALTGRYDLASVEKNPLFKDIVPPCPVILDALKNMTEGAPIRIYFSAAQSEDPSFGRNHPWGVVVTGNHPARYQEGWNRRGNLQIFRDAFEVLYENCGRPISAVWKFIWVALALFSTVVLIDLARAQVKYDAEWKKWKDITKGEVKDMATLTNFVAGDILEDSLVQRMESGREGDPSFLLGYLYRRLTLAGRLEQDLNFARENAPTASSKRNFRAWFDQ